MYFPNNKILVSIVQVVDPIFSKTLIFIIDHNSNGAIGVIINKKINQNNYKIIKDFIPNEKIFSSEILDDLFFGGPIKTKENIIIHSSSSKSIKTSMKQKDKFEIINKKSQINHNETNNEILYKKITGFSSWGSGQLENEIKNGDWLPQEKQKNIIFSKDTEDIWEDMMKSIGLENAEIINHSARA